jgi:hypothetical protein
MAGKLGLCQSRGSGALSILERMANLPFSFEPVVEVTAVAGSSREK